jgi:solute carrier family 34 (sodium-dependent phosphate cotransporter)
VNTTKEETVKKPQKKFIKYAPQITRLIILLFAAFLFLLSIELIGNSFLQWKKNTADSIVSVTTNPFISLFIGLLLTAIIQSSSTSTSMIVALVSTQALTLSEAVPMVMGANVGTTFTSNIVALSFITKKREFRKAISAGTVHDIFNLLIVVILFPLELSYQFLSKLSLFFSDLVYRYIPFAIEEQLYDKESLIGSIASLISNSISEQFFLFIFSFVLLFTSIRIIAQSLYTSLIGESRNKLQQYAFKNRGKSFLWGSVITTAVQSSSITTSLMVPLVATGKATLKRAFPFIMGANLGTTVTALIAALFRSQAALDIALAHFLFNLIGVVLFLVVPALSQVPVLLSGAIGRITLIHRIYGFLYLIIMFFLIPFLLIYFG